MTPSSGPAQSPSISTTMLQGIQANDNLAWQRLMTVWSPVVYNWCRQAGIPHHDAQDVVQNVFLKLARSIHAFKRQSFRAWLWRITTNAIADYFRDNQHRPRGTGGSGSWLQNVASPDLPEDPQSDQDGASEPSPQQTVWLLVHRTLEVIRPDFDKRTFDAFWKTAVEGRPTRDVAKELGMSVEAVRAAKYRVLNRLRQELEAMGLPMPHRWANRPDANPTADGFLR